jgi:predicted kinase
VTDRVSSLLIAGTSHTGKSTLAAAIGGRFGWRVFTTDKLGRHPGRPWPDVLPCNAEYYTQLSAASIYQFLLHLHQNLWPAVMRLIHDMRAYGVPFVLEGSALRAEYLASRSWPGTAIIQLHADHEVIRARIHRQSGYATLSEDHQAIVDRFIERSLRDNDENLAAARRHGLPCLDIADPAALDHFTERFRDRVEG